jgi:hypothetical protein
MACPPEHELMERIVCAWAFYKVSNATRLMSDASTNSRTLLQAHCPRPRPRVYPLPPHTTHPIHLPLSISVAALSFCCGACRCLIGSGAYPHTASFPSRAFSSPSAAALVAASRTLLNLVVTCGRPSSAHQRRGRGPPYSTPPMPCLATSPLARTPAYRRSSSTASPLSPPRPLTHHCHRGWPDSSAQDGCDNGKVQMFCVFISFVSIVCFSCCIVDFVHFSGISILIFACPSL